MKTILSSVFVLLIVFVLQSSASAQQYFTYDGDIFSVLLTANSANTQVTNVEFSTSTNEEWNKFNIIDFQDLESTGEGGFLYTVKDGKGKTFHVDYYRDEDYIIVYSNDYETQWTLTRREE
jgi:hypothetical protein